MKLSDIALDDYIKLLVYGDSGTGKTVLAAGFPTPIRYWDFDHKISSAVKFYGKEDPRLSQIDVTQFAAFSRETRIKEFQKQLNEITSLANAKKPLPFKTLVLDSLTTFVQYVLDDYIYVSQTGIKRAVVGINALQDYQLLEKHLIQTITAILSLDCNVVCLGHMQIEKDEATGQMIRRPLMSGKFADKLPIYFEEVYVSKIGSKGEFLLQTQPDSTYTRVRSQRKLPKEISSKFENIIKI